MIISVANDTDDSSLLVMSTDSLLSSSNNNNNTSRSNINNTATASIAATSSNSSSSSSTASNNINHIPLMNCSHNNLARSSSSKYILGVVYIQECLPHAGEHKCSDEISIGTLILAETHRTVYAHQLRQMIVQQSLFNMDNNYVFLTNFGSPISVAQEISVELKHLISAQNNVRFKRDHSHLRCPVIGKHPNGQSIFIGYVLSTYDTDLKTLRVKIEEVLREPTAGTGYKLCTNFHFIHSFHYSIHRHNESNILLLDIMQSKCVFIQFDNSPMQMQLELNPMFPMGSNDDLVIATCNPAEDQIDSTKPKVLKKPSFSMLRRKTIKKTPTLRMKQIMISYARQEAADHALKLKESLIKRGFSVYLDVHEIEMGSDWQDSLNNAIQSCNFFVPLITPMYGRTQWTNREVKLADVLRKNIIPINFLDFWPPECLAIQFATTQYILWRSGTEDVKELKDLDKKIWDPESIKQVTEQLCTQITKMSKKDLSRELKPISAPTLNNDLPEAAIEGTAAAAAAVGGVAGAGAEMNNNWHDKPLIVISAHPEQNSITREIKQLLSTTYHVWCSNDIADNLPTRRVHEEVPQVANLRDSIYDPNLSPIIEENSTLTHAIQDYARKIAENSKQRPKSEPNHNHEFKLEKKDLSRVVSYNGEGCYLSSISPDKMERLKSFQNKVHNCTLVIVIASEQYYTSRTSEQHVYYCAQRMKTILVQCDKSPAPVWFSKLMSHDVPLTYGSKDFKNELMNKITRVLDPSCKYIEDPHEVKIKYLTDCMKRNLPNLETCVYVLGSSSGKLNAESLSQRTIDICNEIGKELAQVQNINIVTNGFYGTSDIVALTFVEQRKMLQKESNDSVIHIVPLKDSKDYSKKCRQEKDGNFEKVTYGQTYFFGETIKERDSVIARLMDTCILIEGDKDTVHEIEEFIWNDHFVVPVCSTGGAAAGELGVPSKIFTCPNGVSESDWSVLSKTDATASEIAKAVVRVICGLKKAIHEHTVNKKVKGIVKKSNSEKPLKKRTAARKRLNIDLTHKGAPEEESDKQAMIEPSSPEKVLPTFAAVESEPLPEEGCKGLEARQEANQQPRHRHPPPNHTADLAIC